MREPAPGTEQEPWSPAVGAPGAVRAGWAYREGQKLGCEPLWGGELTPWTAWVTT